MKACATVAAPDCRTDARLEFRHLKWLGNKVHCTKIKATHSVHGFATGADENHSDVAGARIFFESLQNFKAIDALEINVEQHDFGLKFSRHA